MNRADVYQAIDGEQAYQQAQGKPDNNRIDDWLFIIHYYLPRAHSIWSNDHMKLVGIRKVAALAVAALEQYGCPPREGYEQLSQRGENEKETITNFYRCVCERAEKNMALTGKLEGSHYNAMRQVLDEMGIEVKV